MCHHTFKKKKIVKVVGSKRVAEKELNKMIDLVHGAEYERHIVEYKGDRSE